MYFFDPTSLGVFWSMFFVLFCGEEEKSSNPKHHKSFFVADIASGFTNLLNLPPRIRGQGGLGQWKWGFEVDAVEKLRKNT